MVLTNLVSAILLKNFDELVKVVLSESVISTTGRNLMSERVAAKKFLAALEMT
jgi:Ran GTPase-activating protein (RanGAP) involved in mRNA processing and transport